MQRYRMWWQLVRERDIEVIKWLFDTCGARGIGVLKRRKDGGWRWKMGNLYLFRKFVSSLDALFSKHREKIYT